MAASPPSSSVQGTHHALVAQQYSGPIPAAVDFKAYNEVLPGAADRILKMAEREQETRLRGDELQIPAAIAAFKRGQWFALFLALAGLGFSAFALWRGETTASLTTFFAILGTFVGSVVYGKLSARNKNTQGTK